MGGQQSGGPRANPNFLQEPVTDQQLESGAGPAMVCQLGRHLTTLGLPRITFLFFFPLTRESPLPYTQPFFSPFGGDGLWSSRKKQELLVRIVMLLHIIRFVRALVVLRTTVTLFARSKVRNKKYMRECKKNRKCCWKMRHKEHLAAGLLAAWNLAAYVYLLRKAICRNISGVGYTSRSEVAIGVLKESRDENIHLWLSFLYLLYRCAAG